jgi:beta-lactamase regulating signal transducer with metallopeptidase domain
MWESLDRIGAAWPGYVWAATWQGTVVALAVLGVVAAARRMPSSLRYGLLVVALVKFALPPHLPAPTGVFSRIRPAVTVEPATARVSGPSMVTKADAPDAIESPAADAEITSEVAAGPHVAPPTPAPVASSATPTASPAQRSVSLPTLLLLLHLVGTAAVLVWIGVGIVRLHRLVNRSTPIRRGAVHDEFQRLAAQLGLRRRVRLLACEHAMTPIALGVFRPAVLLPGALLDELPLERLRAVLAHELGHHRRHDLLVNYFQLLLAAAWWFNPVVGLLNRAVRVAREDCCDDLLLARRIVTSDAYSQTLLAAAAGLTPRVAVGTSLGFAERLHPLSRRLSRIMDASIARRARPSLPVVLSVLLVAVVVLPGLRQERAHAEGKPADQPRPSNVFPLQYTPLDEPFRASDYPSKRGYQETVTAQPLELKELPPRVNPQPWFGETILGRQVVMDTDPRGAWKVIYVDANGDGVLTDDEAFEADPSNNATVSLEAPGLAPRKVQVQWGRGRNFASISWVHLGCVRGVVKFGDAERAVMIYDGNNNGYFNDVVDGERAADMVAFDIDGDGNFVLNRLGEPLRVGDQQWELTVSAHGDSVEVVPAGERRKPPPAAPAGDWKLVFQDDFEREAIGSDWRPMKGHWLVKDGRLYCSAPSPTSKSIVCVRDFGGDQRVEYDAMSNDPCDLTALLNVSSADFTGGLFFGFASEDNAYGKLIVEGENVAKAEGAVATPGRWHKIACQREGDRLFWTVDGRVVMDHTLERPYAAGQRRKVGFYIFNTGYIDNVRIYTKPGPAR